LQPEISSFRLRLAAEGKGHLIPSGNHAAQRPLPAAVADNRYVGVAHGVELPGQELFYAEVHLLGGPAPVRRFLPELLGLIWNRTIDPGRVFDLELALDQAAEGYRAMDERRAIKSLLRP
jgi:hypothetical protein